MTKRKNQGFKCIHCGGTISGIVNYGGGFGRPLGTWCGPCAEEWLNINIVTAVPSTIRKYEPRTRKKSR